MSQRISVKIVLFLAATALVLISVLPVWMLTTFTIFLVLASKFARVGSTLGIGSACPAALCAHYAALPQLTASPAHEGTTKIVMVPAPLPVEWANIPTPSNANAKNVSRLACSASLLPSVFPVINPHSTLTYSAQVASQTAPTPTSPTPTISVSSALQAASIAQKQQITARSAMGIITCWQGHQTNVFRLAP